MLNSIILTITILLFISIFRAIKTDLISQGSSNLRATLESFIFLAFPTTIFAIMAITVVNLLNN